jgi:pimeloyl-ACP methyl ester carboxylesterase
MAKIVPFKISITKDEREDLLRRLRNARWPEPETTDDWSQGIKLDYLKSVVAYWASDYSLELAEQRLNRFPGFKTEIDGLDIHFLHARSSHAHALPLVLTHGWPGSVIEFVKLIEPLTQPEAHGGDPKDAFHVVLPHMPGFGFSGKPRARGWGIERIAWAWDELMTRLGYNRYVTSGTDFGNAVSTYLGVQNRGHVAALHLTMPFALPSPEVMQAPSAEDLQGLQDVQNFIDRHRSYFNFRLNSTAPQTVGYGLVDSPVALAGWIIDKYQGWVTPDASPETVFAREELIDNLMLYWLPSTGASSSRIYLESYTRMFLDPTNTDIVELPVSVSLFPHEVIVPPRSWAENRYKKIVRWTKVARGGHFASLEEPGLFVDELRESFRPLRQL